MRASRLFTLIFLLVGMTLSLCAQDIASFEKRITVKKLANGLTILIMERPEAPVFSFFTYVRVGSTQDPEGEAGLAHMFEHMAFKGTTKIGTTDYPAEKVAMGKVDAAYKALDAERRKPTGSDPKKIAELEKNFQDLAEQARKYVIPNEFGDIVERNGGVGLNAFTNTDETAYMYSFPSNNIELWAYLESERFLHPVFREFYKERDVVVEERRMRTDSSPIGRLVEQLQATAYMVHPYHRSTIGFMSEISNVNRGDAEALYKKYYVPSDIVVTLVGDIKAATAMPILEKYFNRIPAGKTPEDIRSVEPPQIGEKRVVLHETGQPWYVEGYHRPNFRDPDDAVYDAISDLMANGRTSRLYRSLVRDKKIALFAGGQGGFPGDKYPNLYLFYAVPTQGNTPATLASAIHEEIEKLKTTDISDDELRMIKTRGKADLIRGLGDDEGLAQQLGTYQGLAGDWRELFRNEERLEKVTKADIRRVAAKTFVVNNRTVAEIESVPAAGAPATKGGN